MVPRDKEIVMKFRVVFKTPDAVEDALRSDLPEPADEDDEEAVYCLQETIDEAIDFAARWVRYGESVTVEFDTEANTATVVPC
jgi:hypothetical protein